MEQIPKPKCRECSCLYAFEAVDGKKQECHYRKPKKGVGESSMFCVESENVWENRYFVGDVGAGMVYVGHHGTKSERTKECGKLGGCDVVVEL